MTAVRKFLPLILALIAAFAWEQATGQCVMCKAVAEDSAAAEAGFQVGDRIAAINGQ